MAAYGDLWVVIPVPWVARARKYTLILNKTYYLYVAMQPKRISIKDIARKLGVSSTTVSFVLNNKHREKRISEEVAQKVLDLARKLHYEPNHVARGLRTGKTKTIGLMVEDIANHFFANIAKVVEREALKHDYKVLYCSTDDDPEKGKELLLMFKNRQVDGFIITPTAGMEGPIEALIKEKKPVVLMDRYLPGLESSYVMTDSYQGAYEGVSHLAERGFRKIAFVTKDSEQVQMENRLAGYKKALEDAGLTFQDEQVLKIPFKAFGKTAINLVEAMLKTQKPDAVFFATNYLGVAGLMSIKRLGLKIPQDIAVLSFDEHDLFKLHEPGITCIEQPIHGIAEQVIGVLIDHMKGNGAGFVQSMLPPSLVIRGSTGAKSRRSSGRKKTEEPRPAMPFQP